MSERFPRQSRQVAARTIEGAAYLVDPPTSDFFQLNSVATRIWELCDGKNTLHQIATAITEEFTVDLATATRDAEEMIGRFVKMGLIRWEDASPPSSEEHRED